MKIDDTKRCHAKFSFLMKNHVDHLNVVVDVVDDNAQVAYHSVCALRSISWFLMAQSFLWTNM